MRWFASAPSSRRRAAIRARAHSAPPCPTHYSHPGARDYQGRCASDARCSMPQRRLDRRPLLCIRGAPPLGTVSPGSADSCLFNSFVHARDSERVTEAWRSRKCMTSARLGKMLACGVLHPLLAVARRTVSGTLAYMVRSSARGHVRRRRSGQFCAQTEI